ncbi:MAG: hypothetical protein K2W85_11130 [Phycisphaerales bacterium]|nr:hypothetical protein [Phycisphaerales bacterium]
MTVGSIDCTRPIVPIFHGWTDSPGAQWVTDAAAAVRRIPGLENAQVIVMDAARSFDPWPLSGRECCPSFSTVPAQMCLASSLSSAMSNVDNVATSLVNQLQGCASGQGSAVNCDQNWNIPLAIGHSLGGAAAATFAKFMKDRTGGRQVVQRLLTVDTPFSTWTRGWPWQTGTSLGSLFLPGNSYSAYASEVPCHVNLYNDTGATWWTCARAPKSNGVGGLMEALNLVNVRVRTGMTQDCGPLYFHACMADQLGGWLDTASARGFLGNCDTYRGTNWNEGAAPNDWVQTTERPVPKLSEPEAIIWGTLKRAESGPFTTLDPAIWAAVGGNGANLVNGFLRVRSDPATPAVAGSGTASVPIPSDGGYFTFEYQLESPGPGQHAGVFFGGTQALREAAPTPSTGWQVAFIDLSPFAGGTWPIRFAIAPVSTGQTSGGFNVRNIRLLPGNTVVAPCAADFDRNARITAADIFDFLNAWFASPQDPRANFDGLGGIDAADIFAFLNAWFAGC